MRKCAWPRVVSDSLFAKGETKGKKKKKFIFKKVNFFLFCLVKYETKM
jgi:hypothetical protein